MANRNRMPFVPNGRYDRARWVEENLVRVLHQIPLCAGMEGLARMEQSLFPKPNRMPLDPTCPECGHETDDGTVERCDDVFRVRYDCGHVLELTLEQLNARLEIRGRAA